MEITSSPNTTTSPVFRCECCGRPIRRNAGHVDLGGGRRRHYTCHEREVAR